MLLIVLAIAVSAAIGMFSERRWPGRAANRARGALRLLLYFVIPPIVFLNMSRADFTVGLGWGVLIGFLAIAVVLLLAWLVSVRLLRLSRPEAGAIMCSSINANTGYLGYPMVVMLLGGGELASAIAFDVIVSGTSLALLGFGIGAAFGTRAGEGLRERLRAFFLKNPILWAALAGVLVPSSWIPGTLVGFSWILVTLVLPVGFFAVGAVLAERRPGEEPRLFPRFNRSTATVVFTRIIASPAVLISLSLLHSGVPRSILLLSAMPTGLNSMVVAQAYGLDLRTTAEAIAWTTALVTGAALVWVLVF